MEGRRQLGGKSWTGGTDPVCRGGGALVKGEVWTPSAECTEVALRVAVRNRAEPTLVPGASIPRDGGRGCPRSRHPQA